MAVLAGSGAGIPQLHTEQFHDYTVASGLERFAASLEACLTTWRDKGEAARQRMQQANATGIPVAIPAPLAPLLLPQSWRGGAPQTATPRSTCRLSCSTACLSVPSPTPSRCTCRSFRQQQSAAWASWARRPPPWLAPWSFATRRTACSSGLEPAHSCSSRPKATRGGCWTRRCARKRCGVVSVPACAFANNAGLPLPRSLPGAAASPQEVHTLLSAAAVALSHARITWPLLLPVHDAVRDSYRGVAIAPCELGAATVQFNADSLSSSRLPPRLLQLEGQLLLFAQQLAAGGAPAASAACHAATGAAVVNAPPASMAADAEAAGGAWPTHATEGGSMLCVAAAVRHSYALPSRNEEAGEHSRQARSLSHAGLHVCS